MLGTGFRGEPSGAVREMIEEMSRCSRPILAVDVPSGLDCDTGGAAGPAVRAAVTLTLGLAKRGLLLPGAKKFVGELRVLDIGYPPALVAEVLGA